MDALINLFPNPMPVCNNNNAPVFTEGTDPSVEEHTASGVDIGDPVSATDEEDDTLEYTLGGTDAGFFSIDSTSGQLSTNVELDDYETKSSYSITVSVSDGNGGTDEITVTIDVKLRKEEFFEVYYAILLEDNYLDVHYYTIRGYGYDDGTPIYVDNYHLFEGGSSSQTSTGWGSATESDTIAYGLERWKDDYSEDFDFVHYSTKVSVHGSTADAASKTLYQTICNTAADIGTWNEENYQVGLTYPEIANNTSDDILDVSTMLLYLGDDDCDPYN